VSLTLLFKPLPYADADRLFAVTLANDKPQGFQFWPFPKYAAFAREQTVFEGTAAYARRELAITAGDQPRRLEAEVVSASYFSLLGVNPALGRVFSAAEEQVPARDAVVILSDAVWRGAFGADPAVVGRTILLKDRVYSVVGVMPASFRGQTGSTQVWLPVMMAEHFMYEGAATESSSWWMRVVGRLRPDISESSARAQMPALTRRVSDVAPATLSTATRDGRELFQLVPFKAIKVDPDVRRSFIVLLAAVGFVLLIACANTANLLLGRAVARQEEFAVRRALGAGQTVIVRQVLVESLLLAVISGAAAMIVSIWTIDWLSAAKPMDTTGFWSQYSHTFEYFAVSLDPRVAMFNFAVALSVGVLSGVLPARQAACVSLNASVRRQTPTASGFRRLNARAVLVLAEVALSTVLLVSAGLMLKSFARAAAADLGFKPDGVITMTASIQQRRPVAFYRELLHRVSTIPGVQDVSLAAGMPIGPGTSGGTVEVEGRPRSDGELRASFNVVTPGFFRTFGIRQIAGRGFSEDDSETATRVAVINRTFAQAAWPGQDPLGKHVRHGFRVAFGDPEGWTTVVGIVDDVTYGTLEEPHEPMIYLPAWQPLGTPSAMAMGPSTIALRSTTEMVAVVAAVRVQLQALDSLAPLYDISTMTERAANVTSRYRYSSALMAAFAVLAVLLAAIGTYAVIAYSVTSRTREIGIRVALGAAPLDVLRLVLGGSAKVTALGLALGLTGAFAGSRVFASMLYDTAPDDLATFGMIAAVMAAVALLAAFIPATRAMRVDPSVALKAD
jgi:putative ABC transport system permease protein